MGSEALMCVQGAPLIGEAEGTRPHSPRSPGDATHEVRDTGMHQGLLKLQGRGGQGRVGRKKLTATSNNLYWRKLQTRPGPTWQCDDPPGPPRSCRPVSFNPLPQPHFRSPALQRMFPLRTCPEHRPLPDRTLAPPGTHDVPPP